MLQCAISFLLVGLSSIIPDDLYGLPASGQPKNLYMNDYKWQTWRISPQKNRRGNKHTSMSYGHFWGAFGVN